MASNEPVARDLLELFVEIQACGSLSAAARKLGISPSLATRKLAALERALDATLFQRTTRALNLTQSGRVALDWAVRTLNDYGEVIEGLSNMKYRPAGVIRIALSDHAAAVFVPAFLNEFAPRYPKISYEFSTTDHLVNPIDRGYDVMLYGGLIPDSRLVGVKISNVQRVLCATPEYLARRGTPRLPADLAQHDCLAHSPTEPEVWHFLRHNELTAQPVTPLLMADSHLALLEFARHGLGIARISRMTVRADLRSGRLVQLMSDYQCVHQNGELSAVWILYPDRKLLRRTRVFVEAFTAHMKRVLA